jgi:phenylpropionate dioxygenase-like ring-hydroxylating dioxygenase large terminal subunit
MTGMDVQKYLDGMAAEQARTDPPAGFPELPVIPGGRYIDPEFIELEKTFMWRRSWLYACHTDELPEVGSYKLWRKTGSPIIIIRGKDMKIRAFYNTCRHRAAPLVQDEAGKVAGLVCRYHGWTYGLDGELLNLRDKRDFPGLDMSCHNLVEIRCELFGNWVFINEDTAAVPLLEALAPAPDHWQTLQIENTRHVHSASFEVACNWKFMLEAFLETYHLKSIHQNTADRFLDHRGTFSTLYSNGNSFMLTPHRRADWKDPGIKGFPEVTTANDIQRNHNPSYNLFPNLITPVSHVGMPFLVFWPNGPKSMFVDVHWFAPEGGQDHELWPTRIKNFENILAEDNQFAPFLQESVASQGFRGIYLSYQERRIYYWHEELDRRIGVDKVPEHLRVKPMLANWVEKI